MACFSACSGIVPAAALLRDDADRGFCQDSMHSSSMSQHSSVVLFAGYSLGEASCILH